MMKKNDKGLWVCLLLLIYPLSANASIQNALENFSRSFPALWKLATAMAYLIGMYFVIQAIQGFKTLGESKSMMSGNSSIKLPLTYLLVGAVLLYLPSAVHILMLTGFGQESPLQLPTTTSFNPSQYLAVLALIQLVGLIAFIRGWVMIVGTSQQGSHHSMGKAITHIVGGLLALNIGGTIDILNKTFGYA